MTDRDLAVIDRLLIHRAARNRRYVVLVGALVLPWLIAGGFWLMWRAPQLAGESPCYLQWCPKLTSVYPSFVRAFRGPLLLPLQLAMLAAAVSWGTWYSFKAFNSALLACAISLSLIANPYVWQLQGSIMSEALATPLLLAVAVTTLAYSVTGRFPHLVVSMLSAGLAAAVRPSDLLVLVVPLLPLWLRGGRTTAKKIQCTLVCLSLWLIPVALDRAYTHAVLGARQTSLAGRHIFGKAALVDAPPLDRSRMSPLDKRVADLIENGFEPIRRVLRPLHGNVRDIVRLNYEVCIQFACTEESLRDTVVPRATLDEALVRVGRARLAKNVKDYLVLAWDEYRGLWLLHPRKHPRLAHEYNDFLREAGPLPFQQYLGEEAQSVPQSQQKKLYRIDRAAWIAIAFLVPMLILSLAYAMLRQGARPLLIAAFSTLIGVEAICVFIALVGVGIPRYALGLWPLICMGGCLGFYSWLYSDQDDPRAHATFG